MLNYTVLLIFVFFAFGARGQQNDELERRNGFKHVKLGIHIDSVAAEKKLKKEFLEQDEFPAKLYALTHSDLEKIGEISVRNVEVKTYKDLIYQIHVVTDKDPRLMKALESVYGIASYDMKKETYFWKSETSILKFLSPSRKELEMMFISYDILQKMKDDKGKKVEDIADDF